MVNDLLRPYCKGCCEERGIHRVIVGSTEEDGQHAVHRGTLECGHTLDSTEMRLSVGTVYLLSQTHPEYITIDGEIDRVLLDERLNRDDDLGWRGYVWEALGMLTAVYVVLWDKIRGHWRPR